MLCTVAVVAAGCSNDKPAEQSTSALTGPNASLTSCDTYVGNFVFLDANCNGIQDGGEVGVPGVTVKLYTCEGVLLQTTTTDANGAYSFTGFQDDVVKVFFELPAGHTFAPKDAGADGVDSDANADGYTDCFLTECDKPLDVVDAGLCREEEPCDTSIGDRVFLDGNCNGIQDELEGGVPGVTVKLYACEGGLVDETTTDGSGYYSFTGVAEGRYKVCFTLPDGAEWSPANQGGSDGLDSDAGIDGCTDCFAVECDKPNDTVDAGICEEKKGGGEGCTPGFWRNHLSHWGPTGYTPDMLVNDVFNCDLVEGDVTLGEAIDAPQTYGVLVFHAIAALLNATHPDVDYDWTEIEVLTAACAGDKDSLADANEDGCPLSGGNTTGGGPTAGGGSKRNK
jgi:hypothetical protein